MICRSRQYHIATLSGESYTPMPCVYSVYGCLFRPGSNCHMRDAFVFYIIGLRYNAAHYNIILDTIRKEESKKHSSDYELTKYITYLAFFRVRYRVSFLSYLEKGTEISKECWYFRNPLLVVLKNMFIFRHFSSGLNTSMKTAMTRLSHPVHAMTLCLSFSTKTYSMPIDGETVSKRYCSIVKSLSVLLYHSWLQYFTFRKLIRWIHQCPWKIWTYSRITPIRTNIATTMTMKQRTPRRVQSSSR